MGRLTGRIGLGLLLAALLLAPAMAAKSPAASPGAPHAAEAPRPDAQGWTGHPLAGNGRLALPPGWTVTAQAQEPVASQGKDRKGFTQQLLAAVSNRQGASLRVFRSWTLEADGSIHRARGNAAGNMARNLVAALRQGGVAADPLGEPRPLAGKAKDRWLVAASLPDKGTRLDEGFLLNAGVLYRCSMAHALGDETATAALAAEFETILARLSPGRGVPAVR